MLIIVHLTSPACQTLIYQSKLLVIFHSVIDGQRL